MLQLILYPCFRSCTWVRLRCLYFGCVNPCWLLSGFTVGRYSRGKPAQPWGLWWPIPSAWPWWLTRHADSRVLPSRSPTSPAGARSHSPASQSRVIGGAASHGAPRPGRCLRPAATCCGWSPAWKGSPDCPRPGTYWILISAFPVRTFLGLRGCSFRRCTGRAVRRPPITLLTLNTPYSSCGTEDRSSYGHSVRPRCSPWAAPLTDRLWAMDPCPTRLACDHSVAIYSSLILMIDKIRSSVINSFHFSFHSWLIFIRAVRSFVKSAVAMW